MLYSLVSLCHSNTCLNDLLLEQCLEIVCFTFNGPPTKHLVFPLSQYLRISCFALGALQKKRFHFSLGAMTRHFKLHPWRSAKKVFYSSLGARHQDPERILFLSWRKASSLRQHLFFSWRDASRHQNHFNYSIDSTLELHTSFLALSIKHFIFLLV